MRAFPSASKGPPALYPIMLFNTPPARLWCALLALAVSSCKVTPPEPTDWLEVGFRSPEQAFHTYQVALASDMPDLEYRCLGTYFKRENNVNQLAYRAFREDLLDRMPWLRFLAEAQVIERRELPDGAYQIRARVDYLWKVVDVDFVLAREEYYELWAGDKLWLDDAVTFDEALAIDEGSSAMMLSVPLPSPMPPAPGDMGLSEVRVGSEWKIQAFEPVVE